MAEAETLNESIKLANMPRDFRLGYAKIIILGKHRVVSIYDGET